MATNLDELNRLLRKAVEYDDLIVRLRRDEMRDVVAALEAARKLVEVLEAEGDMFDAWFYPEFLALADAVGVEVYRRSNG